MTKDLLIATTNPAKLAEYQLLLRDLDLRILSLRDLRITAEAPEDATTFAANALSKARFYFERAGIPTLADDGGFEVDALDGAPGVKSHRWLGVENPDDALLAHEIIRRMAGVPPAKRTARLRAAAALVYRDQAGIHEEVVEAALQGIVPERCYPEIRQGFPYRSVLVIPERGCYLAELGEEEAARISQRRVLVEKLTPGLTQLMKGPRSAVQ